ncbi:MAG: hypothetical protein KDB63_17895 [Nocardioidaceae bacterium]|nr:hypothetical protein [Nocardioidaceae bacterium]
MPAPAPTDRRDELLDEDLPRPTLGITPTQVAGSALASVSGAFLASWLGVAGTLIGAALLSIVATVGSATYTYSLRRGRQVVRWGRGERTVRELPRVSWRRGLPWPRVALASVAVLAIALVSLTAFEGVTGKSVSALATGSDKGGTTIAQAVGHIAGGSSSRDGEPGTPAPSPSQTPTPTPTSDPSPAPTEQPTPTQPPAPTETPAPSDQPSPSDGTSVAP